MVSSEPSAGDARSMQEDVTSEKTPSWNVREFREWVQLLVFTFATGFAVYTFLFQDIWRPAQRPTALQLTSNLEEVGRSEGYRLIRVRIHALNPSDRRIFVPAFWYSVHGQRLGKQDTGAFVTAVELAPPRVLQGRHAKLAGSEVVASGRITTDNAFWYDPHDKTTNEGIFAIPNDSYDALELRVDYIFTKDTVGLGAPSWAVLPSGEWVVRLNMKSQKSDTLEPFDPSVPLHQKWEKESASGHNWEVVALSLWPAIAR